MSNGLFADLFRNQAASDGVERSFASMLPEPALRSLLAAAEQGHHGQGDLITRPFAPGRPGIVLTGRVRFFVEAWDGRQATVGYEGPGGAVGLPECFAPEIPMGVQAMTVCTLLHFDRALFKQVIASDAATGLAAVTTLATRMSACCRQLRHLAFGSARQRLAGQLLLLGQLDAEGRQVVTLTHQELADAVGTVREHVSRLLREFRDEGLVMTSRGVVAIVDPAGLQAESRIG